MPKTAAKRLGYTFVDVVAVASCMVILSTVLLPVVLRAQNRARGAICKTRMRSIGQSLHNYHDVYRHFPPGWVSGFRDAESPAGFGWQSKLLPFLDQSSLFNRLEMNKPLPEPDELLSMALEAFQCPEDSNLPPKNAYRGGYGRSSYSGNMGDLAPIRWADGRTESFWPGAVPTFHCSGRMAADNPNILTYSVTGLFGWNSNIGIRDVVDGSSNTIACGERSRLSAWGIWVGVGSNRFENDTLTDVSYASPLNKSLTGFSSNHDGGIHVCMADGSVRFLSNSVDSKPEGGVLQHLGNRMDREVIPPNTFTNF